jgi:hypothetical protein
MAKKKLFIVGNGPLLSDMSEQVDGSDHVIRFNEPKASIGMSGTKTNWLFVCNTGKPMERRLKDPNYPTSPIVQAAEFVILVSHPTAVQKYALKPSLWARIKGRRAEWTWASMTMFGNAGKTVAILPPTYYEAGCIELGLDLSQLLDDRTFPTTGYFGIRYALEHLPAEKWDVEIAGFSWQGWKNHTWNQEKEWILRKAEERNIRIWQAGDDWKPKYAKKDRYSRNA